jgi:hypothetical protein
MTVVMGEAPVGLENNADENHGKGSLTNPMGH